MAFAASTVLDVSAIALAPSASATGRAGSVEGFTFVETVADAHRTPTGAVQSFSYSRFVRDLQ